MTCVSVVKQDVLPLQGHCLNRTTRCRAVFSLVSESHQRVHARGAARRKEHGQQSSRVALHCLTPPRKKG